MLGMEKPDTEPHRGRQVMNECIAQERVERGKQHSAQGDAHAAFVGLDVHKETIAIAIARPGRSAPEYRGEIKAVVSGQLASTFPAIDGWGPPLQDIETGSVS
jgi:hypothetical protein